MEIRQLGCVEYRAVWQSMKALTATRTAGAADGDAKNRQKTDELGCDQLWICEHMPVYTQGLAGKAEHVLNAGDIPVVQTDRGGQVTYHGPGQVVAYPLIDLKRAGYFVKEYVYRIEEAVIRTLAHFGVTGHRVTGSPGIYVRMEDPFSHARLAEGAVVEGVVASRAVKRDAVASSAFARRAVIPDLIRDPWTASEARNDSFRGLGKIAALGIKVSRHYTYHGLALNVAMDLEPFSRINPCGYVGLVTTDLRAIGVDCSLDDAAAVLAQKLVRHLTP